MQDKLAETLTKLVAIYPTSNNQQSVEDLLKHCFLRLESTGAFKTLKIVKYRGIYSLYASTKGTKSPKLLLSGHIDVVPASEAMRTAKVTDSKIIGRGAYDMLYATACYLELADELKSQLKSLDIGLMLVGDEELGGFNGTGHFVDAGYSAGVVVLPDAGEGLEQINIGSKGVYSFGLLAEGKAHHGSRPWEGDGAANRLVLGLNELLALSKNTKKDSFTVVVTILSGGDSMNRAPAEAAGHIDVRYKNQAALKSFKSGLSKVLTKYRLKIGDLSEASDFNLDLNNSFVNEFLELYEAKFNRQIKKTKTDGSSDARFFAAKDIPVIMLRPSGGGAHSEDEWISLPELEKFYDLLKQYTLKIAKI